MKRYAYAHWEGSLKEGQGRISVKSGALKNAEYSFGTRFESGIGTNPEELIGAAHSGCYSMALSMILGEAGYTPESIDTKATVNLEEDDDGFAISTVHLDVTAKVPGADEQAFMEAANKAKAGCPVSKLLNAKISMDAKLAG
ncbi:MAG: OsmC family peroxiredoxin [Salinisphaeraceae bacterium]|jgi:osmotically inducible protein OsmC|nr:OsmC family peroxiredoxin [Salinisphaeraceae bacterium]